MNIGIIGLGNMGTAILQGLLHKYNHNQIWVVNHQNDRVSALRKKYQFHFATELNEDNSAQLDVIFVTLPANIVIKYFNKHQVINQNSIIISAAAGITIKDLKNTLPSNQIVTLIPNTPVSVNAGTLPTCFSDLGSDSKPQVIKILSILGNIIPVKENNLSVLGTICGCGPAFIDVLMDALGDAAVENGINRNTAYQAIASMVSGSG
ncbi:pyrroline-5-carboxylate reductase [Philodulcilactobacillus myokoensis]|uniref:Pyrroline-5-carboxylate reductase n=1 Tax=Philodulcilactobacillus myokoensis TaxID=2929573 RepID=A0A9W6B400_9LACO|nr:pyrroline-5-carboxylate reductase [Philodulcilactobacillus myokoensis]